jgi:hypothetical protein
MYVSIILPVLCRRLISVKYHDIRGCNFSYQEFLYSESSNGDFISDILIHLLLLNAGITWTSTRIHPVV